jgi:serine/threonine-protein kinase
MDDKRAAESEAGKAYGTPYYISPEQIRGDVDIDFRADIYSLGATLYHLVTGRPPFEADTPSAVMHKHLREALTPPDHINTSLSAGISEIVEVAMAKKREERYAATKDMLEDLIAVRNGEPPIHARRDIKLEELAKVEEAAAGKTVDLEAGPSLPFYLRSDIGLYIFIGLCISAILNVILVAVLLTSHHGTPPPP